MGLLTAVEVGSSSSSYLLARERDCVLLLLLLFPSYIIAELPNTNREDFPENGRRGATGKKSQFADCRHK
jgi:hypothetical protein